MTNWEFDDSVDFAPPHYRKSKYQKVEQLGKQIINEATALEYLEAFQYVAYLSKYHKIDKYVCFKKMQLNFDSKLNLIFFNSFPSSEEISKEQTFLCVSIIIK